MNVTTLRIGEELWTLLEAEAELSGVRDISGTKDRATPPAAR
jgi:hypothetical protein